MNSEKIKLKMLEQMKLRERIEQLEIEINELKNEEDEINEQSYFDGAID